MGTLRKALRTPFQCSRNVMVYVFRVSLCPSYYIIISFGTSQIVHHCRLMPSCTARVSWPRISAVYCSRLHFTVYCGMLYIRQFDWNKKLWKLNLWFWFPNGHVQYLYLVLLLNFEIWHDYCLTWSSNEPNGRKSWLFPLPFLQSYCHAVLTIPMSVDNFTRWPTARLQRIWFTTEVRSHSHRDHMMWPDQWRIDVYQYLSCYRIWATND